MTYTFSISFSIRNSKVEPIVPFSIPLTIPSFLVLLFIIIIFFIPFSYTFAFFFFVFVRVWSAFTSLNSSCIDVYSVFLPLVTWPATAIPEQSPDKMTDVQIIREDLSRATQSARIVMRCLNSGRDSQESSQRALTLLADILDLIYRFKDQISWGQDKWLIEPSRLTTLAEILSWFDMTMKSIELYFQPGGVGVVYFRKHLLERTFLPRLEQYKVLWLLSLQPDSR